MNGLIHEQIKASLREPQTVELEMETPPPVPQTPTVFGSFPIMGHKLNLTGPFFWMWFDAVSIPLFKKAVEQGLSGPGTFGNRVALRLDLEKLIIHIVKF